MARVEKGSAGRQVRTRGREDKCKAAGKSNSEAWTFQIAKKCYLQNTQYITPTFPILPQARGQGGSRANVKEKCKSERARRVSHRRGEKIFFPTHLLPLLRRMFLHLRSSLSLSFTIRLSGNENTARLLTIHRKCRKCKNCKKGQTNQEEKVRHTRGVNES